MRMGRLLFMLAACVGFLVPGPAHADGYVKTKMKSSGFAGFGGMKGETETWISGNRQAQRDKLEFSNFFMRQLASGEKTRTVTDLDRGVILQIDDKEKTYTEFTFEGMMARMEEARAQMQQSYSEAETGAAQAPPRIKDGDAPEVKVEVLTPGDTKKIAGLEGSRTILKLLATGTDQETGEEVTFKFVYDAYLSPEFPAQEEFAAFGRAYGEKMGAAFTESDLGLATAFANAGMTMGDFEGYSREFEGYPIFSTFTYGVQLTEEQRAQMEAEAKAAEEEKKDSKGGFGGIGGLGKKLQDKAEDALAEKMVKSMFGEGVTFDEDGDPVLMTLTTELSKVETGAIDAGKVFSVPENYRKMNP